MKKLREHQFREVCRGITDTEESLRHRHLLSLSTEERLRRYLATPYTLLNELWPIIPGRGSKEEPEFHA